jgi:hypothetical protein
MMKKENALSSVSNIWEAVGWPLSARAAAIIGVIGILILIEDDYSVKTALYAIFRSS